jgi:uncharacterized protein (DUF2147 family)
VPHRSRTGVPLIGGLPARYIRYFRKQRVTGIILPPKRTAVGIRIDLAMTLLVQLFLVFALSSTSELAAELPAAGLWRTIDDRTGKPRGLVHITEVSGQYQGRLEKTFPQPGEDPYPKCDKCSDSRRDQPVIGMTILWGMTRQGEDYQGGQVLDPENGKIYWANMKLEDGGKTLHVRGFIGISLLGRTQIWMREE